MSPELQTFISKKPSAFISTIVTPVDHAFSPPTPADSVMSLNLKFPRLRNNLF